MDGTRPRGQAAGEKLLLPELNEERGRASGLISCRRQNFAERLTPRTGRPRAQRVSL